MPFKIQFCQDSKKRGTVFSGFPTTNKIPSENLLQEIKNCTLFAIILIATKTFDSIQPKTMDCIFDDKVRMMAEDF